MLNLRYILKYKLTEHELQEKALLVCDHFFQILEELQVGFRHTDVGGEFLSVRFGDFKFDDHVFLESMFIDSPPECRKFRVVSGECLPGVLKLQKHHWVYAQNIFLFLEVVFWIRMQRRLRFMMCADHSADIQTDGFQYKIFAQELQDVGIVCYNYRREKTGYCTRAGIFELKKNDGRPAERSSALCWKTQRNGWLKMSSAV